MGVLQPTSGGASKNSKGGRKIKGRRVIDMTVTAMALACGNIPASETLLLPVPRAFFNLRLLLKQLWLQFFNEVKAEAI